MTLYESVEEAFEQCGIRANEGYDMRTARRSLSLILKRWQNYQVNFWQMEDYVLSCEAGTASYRLAEDSIDLVLVSIATSATGSERDLGKPMSFQDYHQIPNKTQLGTPTRFMVHKESSGPVLYLWPVPNSSDLTVNGYRLRGDSVQDTAGDWVAYDQSLPVPSRFEPALIAALAAEIGSKKIQDPGRRAELRAIAKELWVEAVFGDTTRASIFLRPEFTL